MKVRFNAYRLFLTTTFFLVTSIVTAGTTGKISGTVTDASTGEGLAGANVMVAGSVLGASTDETGYYFIININPGTYEVSATYMGYETNTVSNVRVSVDQTTDLGFQLASSVIEGSEVNVTAERAIIEQDVTGSKSVLTSEFLENTADSFIPISGGVSTSNSIFGYLSLKVYIAFLFSGASSIKITFLVISFILFSIQLALSSPVTGCPFSLFNPKGTT